MGKFWDWLWDDEDSECVMESYRMKNGNKGDRYFTRYGDHTCLMESIENENGTFHKYKTSSMKEPFEFSIKKKVDSNQSKKHPLLEYKGD